jgi:hypothetical protein
MEVKVKLLEKYKGLVFLDHENGGMVQTICSENLEWRRKNKSMGVDYSGYYLISIGADDEEEYSWEINQTFVITLLQQSKLRELKF